MNEEIVIIYEFNLIIWLKLKYKKYIKKFKFNK